MPQRIELRGYATAILGSCLEIILFITGAGVIVSKLISDGNTFSGIDVTQSMGIIQI